MKHRVHYSLLLAVGLSSVGPIHAEPVKTHFEQMARSYSHFSLSVVVRQQPLRLWGNWSDGKPVAHPWAEEQLRLLGELRAASDNLAELKPLLQDPDPKVRTLALGAILQREDGHDLPLIAALMDDPASTFPDLHDSMSQAGGPRPLSEIEDPQTVGLVARRMIQFYLDAAKIPLPGANYRPASSAELKAAFDQYWAERKDRASCASWYLVKLERATRRTEPVQPQYQADIDAVFAQIRTLPSPDRDWTLFYAVYGEALPDAHSFVPDAELLLAAKSLGPDALMKLLLLQPLSDDPDLRFTADHSDPRSEEYVLMLRFILEHATELLRPSDGAALRVNATSDLQHWNSATPLWMKAADALQPIQDRGKAAAELKAQMAEVPTDGSDPYRQVKAALSLWHLSGAAEKEFLAGWFYTLHPERDHQGETLYFLQAVDKEARPDTPELLAAIVADPSFDTTGFDVVKQLLESAGGGPGKPLVALREILANAPSSRNPGQSAVLNSWRNVLRRHFGLPEHT